MPAALLKISGLPLAVSTPLITVLPDNVILPPWTSKLELVEVSVTFPNAALPALTVRTVEPALLLNAPVPAVAPRLAVPVALVNSSSALLLKVAPLFRFKTLPLELPLIVTVPLFSTVTPSNVCITELFKSSCAEDCILTNALVPPLIVEVAFQVKLPLTNKVALLMFRAPPDNCKSPSIIEFATIFNDPPVRSSVAPASRVIVKASAAPFISTVKPDPIVTAVVDVGVWSFDQLAASSQLMVFAPPSQNIFD